MRNTKETNFAKDLVYSEFYRVFTYTARKHLRAKVTPSLHLKYSENGGIDKHSISLFLNIPIDC